MKKICSLFFCFLLVISVSHAQEKAKYEVGFQGGWVLGTANGSAVDNPFKDALSGVGFGFNFKRNLNERLAFKVGINYEQMGWANRNAAFEPDTIPRPGFFSYADILYRLTYLNTPILCEYNFGKKLQFNISAGAFVGFLLSSKTIIKYKNVPNPDEESANNNFKSINGGVAVGLGLSYPLTSTIKINLQGSQQFGLTNVGKNASNSTTKLNAFSLTTGLSFAL